MKINCGFIVLQRLIDLRQTVVQSGQHAGRRYFCNLVWMKHGGLVPWTVTVVQDLLSDGKTPHERRFGKSIVWANNNFFWSKGGVIIRFSARDSSGLHQFGKKVLPGIFIGWVLKCPEASGRRDITGTDVEELEQ